MATAQKTTDHEVIRAWVEERGGRPTTVKGTGTDGKPGVLRIDFPIDGMDEGLEPIEWEDFFEKFEEANLAFLHQDTTDNGELSRFCKFIERDE